MRLTARSKSKKSEEELDEVLPVKDDRLTADEQAWAMKLQLDDDEEADVFFVVGKEGVRILDAIPKKKKQPHEKEVNLSHISEFFVTPNSDDRDKDEFKFTYQPTKDHPGDPFVFLGKSANFVMAAINESIKEKLVANKVKDPDKVLKESGLTPRSPSGGAKFFCVFWQVNPQRGGEEAWFFFDTQKREK